MRNQAHAMREEIRAGGIGAGLQRGLGSSSEIGRHLHIIRQVGHAAGMDHPHHDMGGAAGKAREIRFCADDREGARGAAV